MIIKKIHYCYVPIICGIFKKIFFYFLLFIFLLLIFFFLLKIFDNYFLYNYISNKNFERFLLPPEKKVKYITHEFNIVVSTNKFGFRGDDKFLKEKQIIVVGDSQTFGWGLNNNETWPFYLKSYLDQADKNLEVYNLGVPGTHTNEHIFIAKEYINKFKPKISIIAIGLSDDLQQILEQEILMLNKVNISKNNKSSKINFLKKKIKNFYPNIYYFFKKIQNYSLDEIFGGYLLATKDWKYVSKEIFEKEYPIEIKELMKKGFINPGIFQLANYYPNRNLSFYKNIANNDSLENKIFNETIQNFKDLKKIADNNNTKLFLLSIPSGGYVDSLNFENLKKFGFMLSNEDLETFLPEEILENMSNEINVNFIKTLRLFRDLKKETFFAYDGHFNREGAKFMSEIIYNYLEKNFF
jgi:lysophospholipase L1-like esterase